MHILSFQHVLLFLAFTFVNMCHVFVDHLSGPDWQCCFGTYSPWKQCNKVSVPRAHADAVLQFCNLICTWGRSHFVCYINKNKRSFHRTSPILSDHRDRSEAPGDSPVFLPSFLPVCFSLPCKSFTHHLAHYLELDPKVMFKFRVHHRVVESNNWYQLSIK